MANGTINLNSNNAKMEARINWRSSSNGSSANTSNVYAELQVRRPDGYVTKGTFKGTLSIDWQNEGYSYHTSINTSWQTIKSFTKNGVPHASDGSGTCRIWAEIYGPSGTSLSGAYAHNDVNVTLDKIPRYLSITHFSVQSTGLNDAVIKWGTSDPRNSTSYSLNGGGWVGSATHGESVASDQKSGTFNVKGLSPNKTYKIKIKCTRTDSGLETTSNEISFTTKNYATINNLNDGFSIYNDQSLTIKINKPCSNNVEYYLDCPDGSTRLYSGNTTSTSHTFSASQIQSLLKHFPNSTSNSLRAGVITRGSSNYYNSRSGRLYIRNSNPSFSDFKYQDTDSNIVNNLTGNNQTFIKNYSNIKITVPVGNKMVARNYATAKTYRFVSGNSSKDVNYSSNSDVSASFSNISSPIVRVFAIDSRGYQTSVEKSIRLLDYYKCVFDSFNTYRSNAIGTSIYIKANGRYDTVNFGKVSNTILSIKIRCKKSSDNSYSQWYDIKSLFNISGGKITSNSGNNFSQYTFVLGTSYDLEISLTDRLSTFIFNSKVESGNVLVSMLKDKGVALGGLYDKSIGKDVQIKGESYIDNGILNGLISVDDYRSENISPDKVLKQRGVNFHFKSNSTDGLNDGGIYHGVMNIKQWGDKSGGKVTQIAFTDNNNIWTRKSGSDYNSWGGWKKLGERGPTGATGPRGPAGPAGPTDLKKVYPVGAIYMSMSSTSPASLFGGTWEQLLGRFLLGVGHADNNNSGFYGDLNKGSQDYWSNSGSKAGQFYHKITYDELPVLRHYQGDPYTYNYDDAGSWMIPNGNWYGLHNIKEGKGYAHNNMPPFITVFMWKRTA